MDGNSKKLSNLRGIEVRSEHNLHLDLGMLKFSCALIDKRHMSNIKSTNLFAFDNLVIIIILNKSI